MGAGRWYLFMVYPPHCHRAFNSTSRARGEQFFLDCLAQQSLNVGEGVGKLDFGEGVVDFEIGHEQPALISFQPLNLKVEVVGHRFNPSPLGQMQPFPKSWLGHGVQFNLTPAFSRSFLWC